MSYGITFIIQFLCCQTKLFPIYLINGNMGLYSRSWNKRERWSRIWNPSPQKTTHRPSDSELPYCEDLRMPKVSVYTSLPGVEISLIFFSCRRKAVGGGGRGRKLNTLGWRVAYNSAQFTQPPLRFPPLPTTPPPPPSHSNQGPPA